MLADDPLLTCRIEGGVNPIRIICDTHLKLPLESQIVNKMCIRDRVMKITAHDLKELDVVDDIIPEFGGADEDALSSIGKMCIRDRLRYA